MLLATIGGITQALLILFNWIVSPFAKFGFEMRAYKRLYFARTNDDSLFRKKPKDNMMYFKCFEESEFAHNPFAGEYSHSEEVFP
jgi:hypothetical protein